ncbi:MAG: 4Fe-4S dicluster domain-containing protein [Rhizobiaceae bacterium]|nr:4Fe-4S dicluster domain-containing protein [Rhizobiaceae bacterium]
MAPVTEPTEIAKNLSAHGLILRGGFVFSDGEQAPAGPFGRPTKSVLLVGQAGAAPWPHFQQWLSARPGRPKNPLDTWAREVIGGVAEKFGASAVSPSDRPYLPFQQWAIRAEGLRPSPLGILMHPEYGLWHAYRGALLFDAEVLIPEPREVSHLCDACAEKPCMKACPVDAHAGGGFAYNDCLAHVRGAAGGVCRDTGCLDRNVCPYGVAYRYPVEVQAFHMAAFAGLADGR